MIYLITGTPNSAKTLYCVSQVKKLLIEGRQVYTDIDGLDFSDVDIPQHAKNNLHSIPVPHPTDVASNYHDFRDLPHGSVIFYDECQKRFPSTGRSGPTQFDCIRALDTHRHDGYDIYFITQHHTLLDVHARKFINRHYHLENKRGLDYSTIYMVENATLDPSDKKQRRDAEKIAFKYPKSLYGTYKSSSLHTKRLSIPKKLIFFILGIGFLTWWVMKNAEDSSIVQNAVGMADGSLLGNESVKPSSSSPSEPSSIPQRRGFTSDGYQYTTRFDSDYYMAVVGEIGPDLILEIGQPPESYQISTFELSQAGALVDVVTSCFVKVVFRGSKYLINCPAHSRPFPIPEDEEVQPEITQDSQPLIDKLLPQLGG